jgi:serine protease Do
MKPQLRCSAKRASIICSLACLVFPLGGLPADDMTPMDHARSLSIAFRKAAQAVKSSVVTINTSYRFDSEVSGPIAGAAPADPADPGTPPARPGRPPGGRRFPREEGENDDLGRPTSVGSGLIFAEDGVVLTNNHVVQDAYEVIVRLPDGSEYKADNILTDPSSDLAVLRIHPDHKLPTAAIGNSSQLEIGDWVIAIGSPFNLEATVSAGIISAKGRSMPLIERSRLLQTDAAINPGNSGGPLVNLNGEVIGINTAIATNTGAFQGVGFAVPIDQAKWVAKELLEHGRVRRAYLGVLVGELTADAARRMNLPARSGAWVTSQPSAEAPAGKAGVQLNDVVVEFADSQIRSDNDLREVVEKLPIGSDQTIVVMREGKRVSLNVKIEALPERTQPAPRERRKSNDKKKRDE